MIDLLSLILDPCFPENQPILTLWGSIRAGHLRTRSRCIFNPSDLKWPKTIEVPTKQPCSLTKALISLSNCSSVMLLKRDNWLRPNSDTLWWIVQREPSTIRVISQLKPRKQSSTNVSSFMSNFGLPTYPVSTLFGELSEIMATCDHLVRIGNSPLRWQSQNINWKFLVISTTASLLVCDTKWHTFCKAWTAFSKRMVKLSVITMSFFDWCCS